MRRSCRGGPAHGPVLRAAPGSADGLVSDQGRAFGFELDGGPVHCERAGPGKTLLDRELPCAARISVTEAPTAVSDVCCGRREALERSKPLRVSVEPARSPTLRTCTPHQCPAIPASVC